MKIAAAQINLMSGDLPANTSKMIGYMTIASRRSADVIVFPELCDTGYEVPVIKRKAQTWDKGTVPELCEAASRHKINVVAGVSERTGNDIFNSTVIIDRSGKIVSRYRKTHLFKGEPFREHECFTPGEKLESFLLEDVHCGAMTCYDIRFPEVARTLRFKGADIIFVPSAFPLVRVTHWTTLLAARAIENQVFIVGCNRVGFDERMTFCGTTTIFDPYGTPVASGSAVHEGLVWGEIELGMVGAVRSQLKVHEDRRPSLYAAK